MIKYSLIGCGRISTNHIKAAEANGLELFAVCDLIPENMETALTQHGLEGNDNISSYTDYKKMLEEKSPQLVAIATDSGSHAQIALDCIEAGCHVIIEKPISLSLVDADNIIKSAKEKGTHACACHQNRFNISVQHIRRAIDQGRFGKISHGSVHVRWNRDKAYYNQASWRGTWACDGGALMNQSIHGIDLLRWLLGDDIEEVFAYTAKQFHPYTECEDVGLAVVKFKNGTLATIEGTTNVFQENLEETLYIFGEKGTAKAGGKSANNLEVWRFADSRLEDEELKSGIYEQVSNIYGNGHVNLYADMIDAIKTGRRPYIDAEAGRRALELVLAIYKSAFEKRPVKLPLGECDILEFRGSL